MPYNNRAVAERDSERNDLGLNYVTAENVGPTLQSATLRIPAEVTDEIVGPTSLFMLPTAGR